MKKYGLLLVPLIAIALLTNCGNQKNKFTVTWVNSDGEVLERDENVAYGTMPSYDGDTPMREDDETKLEYYMFSNWSPVLTEVTSDQTYTAQYCVVPESIIKAKIYKPNTFFKINYDGALGRIDWGDEFINKDNSHKYKEGGDYTIKVYGRITSLSINVSETSVKVTDIELGNLINKIDDRAFEHSDITNMVIPSGVTSIGNYAFQGCDSLETITIPDTVISIGDYAFYGCYCLESINIPSNVSKIGAGVLSHCDGLATITVSSNNSTYTSSDNSGKESNVIIDKTTHELVMACSKTEIPTDGSITSIGKSSFEGIGEYWGDITIPDGVTTIGEKAFAMSRFEHITLPNSLTSIGASAFANCEYLSDSIEIPSGITAIPNSLFEGCVYLKSVILPNGIKTIGESAFYDCIDLEVIEIPDTVETIGESAFYNCSSLTSVDIPESVNFIGLYAFYKCSALVSINIPKKVTAIGDKTFADCVSLESITFTDGLLGIGSEAFANTGLTSVSIPKSVVSIAEDSFINCPNITSITVSSDNPMFTSQDLSGAECNAIIRRPSAVSLTTITLGCSKTKIPNEVSNIYNCAFQGCSNLESIELPKGLLTIGANAFADSGLTSISIPNKVHTIDVGAFSGCTKLASVTFDNDPMLTKISNSMFAKCSSLTSIALPDTILTIEEAAFVNSGLTSINIPINVCYIGDHAFDGCNKLESIEVTANNATYTSQDGSNAIITRVKVLGTEANSLIFGCKNTKIPNTVKAIMGYAFSGCNISAIDIPEGVEQIYTCAFRDCIYLTSITIPSTVTAIGNGAFYNCASLKTAKFTEDASLKALGGDVFENCVNLESINIPSSVEFISYATFWGCRNLKTVDLTKRAIPPVFIDGDDPFRDCPYAKFYVSDVDTYKNNEYWAQYANRIYPAQ